MDGETLLIVLAVIATVAGVVGAIAAVAALTPRFRRPPSDEAPLPSPEEAVATSSATPKPAPRDVPDEAVGGCSGTPIRFDGDLLVPHAGAAGATLDHASEIDENLEIAVSPNGRLAAWLSDRRVTIATIRSDRSLETLGTSAPLAVEPAARVLAVGRKGADTKVVIDDGDSIAIVLVRPGQEKPLIQRRPGSASAAAVVRTEAWVLVNGSLSVPASVKWVPPQHVIDFDVSGSVGQEAVAVLYGVGPAPALMFVTTPYDTPVRTDWRAETPAPAAAVALVREPFNRPTCVAAHLDNGAVAELPLGGDAVDRGMSASSGSGSVHLGGSSGS